MLSTAFVEFYRVWHGGWHLPGSRRLLLTASAVLPGLQRYPLRVRDIGTVTVDFRDAAGLHWLQSVIDEDMIEPNSERTLVGTMLGYVADGDVVWDIGANLGLVTAGLHRMRPHSPIVACEPSPKIAASLRELVAAHPEITVCAVALSDHSGVIDFGVFEEKSTMSAVLTDETTTGNDLPVAGMQRVRVPCVTGDDLLVQTGRPPKVIKIDVEGHEAAVFRGLRATIAQHRPTIFFEHLWMPDAAVQQAIPQGYTLRSIENGTGRLTRGFEREAGHNSILIPD